MNARSVAFAFRAEPLTLVAVFTIGLLLAFNAGFLGIWLGVLLISWFFKYCFVMLDAIVDGADQLPVLSLEMVNPVSEQRPVAAGALIAAGVWLVFAAHKFAGNVLSIPVAAVLLAALPASLATLGVTRNPLKAIWPRAWLACIRGLGSDYLWLTALIMLLGGAIYALWRTDVSMLWRFAATQELFLVIVALIGAALHEHRNALGIATLTRAERLAARDERDLVQQRRESLDRAYGLLRVNQTVDAWSEIDGWLTAHKARGDNLPEYRLVFEAVAAWKDARVGDRLTDELIGLLMMRRDTGVALEVCEKWLVANPNFRPTQRARLAELASLAGKRVLRRQLEEQSTPS